MDDYLIRVPKQLTMYNNTPPSGPTRTYMRSSFDQIIIDMRAIFSTEILVSLDNDGRSRDEDAGKWNNCIRMIMHKSGTLSHSSLL